MELSRVILSFICGYFLTVSGSLTQIVSNNKLASPSTLGFDGAAVLAILISQVTINLSGIGISLKYLSLIVILIFIFTWVVLTKIFASATEKSIWSKYSMNSLVLFGLAFNLLVGAIFSVIQFLYMAMNFEFPTSIWFGSLKQYDSYDLFLFIPGFFIVFYFLFLFSKKLELLNIGTLFSLGLKINVYKLQRRCLLLAFLLTGIVICHYGVFSFLGLVFPHILRHTRWWKNSIKGELMYGSLLTATIFSLIDYSCYYYYIYGAELPVGMISSVMGASVLIFMVFRASNNSR